MKFHVFKSPQTLIQTIQTILNYYIQILKCVLKTSLHFAQNTISQNGLDVKVENFKAEKVFNHFRGGVFKAEWLVGC